MSVNDTDIYSFAGIYDVWTDPDIGEILHTCAIVTCPANETMMFVHNGSKNPHRMPVTMIEIHKKDIKKYNDKITELENKTGESSTYAHKNPDDVLANTIICTYSMNDLSGNNFTEKSEFVLSPDKSRVYKARIIQK